MSPFLYEPQCSDVAEPILHAIDEIKWDVRVTLAFCSYSPTIAIATSSLRVR